MALTPLDYVNLGWIGARTFLPEVQRWRNRRAMEGVRVFYGFDTIPARTAKSGGGIIKIQDLERAFPNCPLGANLVYLVSSARPYFAVRMARLARRAGAGIVINQNGVAYPGWFGKGWKRHNRPMQQLLMLADHVFYQSRFCKLSADRFLTKPACGWEILYNPVDTRVFVPSPDRSAFTDDPRLLIAGSHQSRYRPGVALAVLKRVLNKFPRARLTIAGGLHWERDAARAHSQLVDDINRMRIAEHVEIKGSYSQVQAVGLFQESHLLLHTKYNDPCPRLVVEAMACGLPVVYSATGGVPELVGKNAGVGVSGKLDWRHDIPPSADKMAEGVLTVLSDWKTFSRAARCRAVSQFDVKPWLRRHETVFRHIIKRKRAA